LRLFSFGGYGLALAALALVGFGAIECPPQLTTKIWSMPAALVKTTINDASEIIANKR